MRIAFYHYSLPQAGRKPGGVEVFVDRLADALVRSGHEVTVFTYARPSEPRSYAIELLKPARAARSALLRQYVASWQLNVRAFHRSFDVVHLHGDDWFFWRRKLPSVRTFYGAAVFEAATATSWKRRLNSSVIFALELLAARRADAVYGIGADSRTLFGADGVLGLGVHEVAATSPPDATRPPVILFVGTWEGRKRGRMLRDAFADTVRPQVPGAELWMVSDYAEESAGLTWFQHPSDAELAELYARASVFCLPSSYEGLGIPYIEAMAHGLPVVATPNLGAIEVLRGGQFGLMTEPRELGAALVTVLTDERVREDLAAASRQRAATFSWSRVLEDYEEAYRLAIERFELKRSRSER
jgi:phosphatidyl-myo-inositol alpha-mannosyltransferase